MGLHAGKLLGISITNSPKKDILEFIEKRLETRDVKLEKQKKNYQEPLVIMTPNPEQVVLAQKNSLFRDMLNRADVAIPDGTGLVIASKFLSKTLIPHTSFLIPSVIPGIEFMEELVELAAKRHVPIALIGGRENVAIKAFECLRQTHPELIGVALEAPEFEVSSSGLSLSGNLDDYFQNLAKTLDSQRVGMVFVALGAPKQELFIEHLSMSLRGTSQRVTRQSFQIASPSERTRNDNQVVLMSVGGSLDEIAGVVPRAPRWVTKIGMKWLWRLVLEPWRWKRQLALMEFLWLVIRERYSLK